MHEKYSKFCEIRWSIPICTPLLEKGGIYISGAAVAAPSAPFRAVGLRAARRRADGANAYRTGR